MDNNFENNGYLGENAGIENNGNAENPPVGGEYPVGGAPVPPPTYTAYYDSNNGYAPYGYYRQRPEAPKKKSTNKKTGMLIAFCLVAVSIVLLVVVSAFALVKGNKNSVSGGGGEKETVNAEIPFAQSSDDSTAESVNAKSIYEKTYKSNVAVIVYANTQSTIASEGSGVILPTVISGKKNDGKTYIVTCAHVLGTSSAYKTVVKTHDGEQYEARVVGIDRKTDIGVLSIDATGLKAAEFADSSKVSVGDTVYALGNPGGSTFFGSFTNGMVSAIGRPVDSPVGYEVSCIQHTAAINPGNSGGALLNSNGQVIGINSSKIASTAYEGMGFCVPSETVKEIVENIIAHGYVTGRAILGITFVPSTYSQIHSIVAQTNDLPKGSLIIYGISDNSDLKNKDVKEGDMVIGFNGKDLDDYNDFLDFVEKGKVGDEITLKICRIDQNYKITTFDVTAKLVEDKGDFIAENK